MSSLAESETPFHSSPLKDTSPCIILFMMPNADWLVNCLGWKGTFPDNIVYWTKNKIIY